MLTPKEEIAARVSKLQALMQKNECEGFLISQNVDLYYFSGTLQNAQLYVPVEGEPVLFCRKSYTRAKRESPWEVVSLANFKLIPERLADLGFKLPQRLALEFDVIPVASYLFYKKTFNQATFVDGSNWVKDIRSVKSAYEIDILRTAGKKIAWVFERVPELLRPGFSEFETAAKVENLMRETGHQGCIRIRGFNQEFYYGLLLAGENGALASFNDGVTAGAGLGPFYPQGPGERLIKANEPVFLDYVGTFGGYMVDKTRLFVIGSLPEKLDYAFRTALEIQEAVLEQVKPGVNAGDLYELAVSKAEKAGLGENFMGFGPERVKFVGHGIGLELDEMPVLAKGFNLALQEGMVFALEPKFVFPGLGIAGIENTWVVTAAGAEKITIFPDDLVSVSL